MTVPAMVLKYLDVHLKGPDLQPENIPVRDLFEFLLEYEGLLRSLAARSGSSPRTEQNQMYLRLVAVEKGSVKVRCAAPEQFHRGNCVVSEVVQNRRPPPPEALPSFLALHEKLRKRGWRVEFAGDDLEPFTLSEELPFGKALVEAETTIYGQCIRVGGQKATVKLLDGKGHSITIHLSRALAKEVAKHLYEEIGLRGLATWELRTQTLVSMKVWELLPYHKTSPAEAVGRLAQVAGKDWERIGDPEKFLKELWGDSKGVSQ